MRKERGLLSNCRQECGSKIFLQPTLQKVIHCYDEYEHGKSDADARNQRCLDEMGSKYCVSPGTQPRPQTVVINTTEYLHDGTKRNYNRKISFPDSISSLNSCIKTCVKNDGIVQFNPNGTPVKSTKTAKDGNEEKKQKNGKHYELCANQLGCQLVPVDKKLEKQVKQLCKFQPGPQDDYDSQLCTCLENTLGQNLHCAEKLSSSESCSSSSTSCSESRKVGSK